MMSRAFTITSLAVAFLAGAVGCGGTGATEGISAGSVAASSSGAGGAGGAATASSTSASSGGSGGGAPCAPVDDGNPCTDDVCEGDIPVHSPVAAGTALSAQTIGDCQQAVCDGKGAVSQVEDHTDVLVDGNPCTDDLCVSGAPSNPSRPQGTLCGLELVCNATGVCVGCNVASDCFGVDDECQSRTCMNGICGAALTPAGTPVAAQTPGDCQLEVCDGSGATTSVAYAADLPADDGNLCTTEVCNSGVPAHQPRGNGSACDDGDACTQTDTCEAGACVGGNLVTCAAPDQCHVAGVCSPATGACSNPPRPDGFACDDASACSQTDTCQAGACVGGNPVVCNAGAICYAGVCPATIGAVAYQIDPVHSGAQPGFTLPLPLTQKWSRTLGGAVSYPLIAGGRVFVTTASGVAYGTQLHALDEHTGATLWGPIALGGPYSWSGAAYDAGKVFAVNFNGILRAFDETNGALLWMVQLPGQYAFSSPPTAVGGNVYVGGAGSGGTVYAVDEATGSVLWTASVANGDHSSPVVAPGSVYVSYICDQVYSFNPASGALSWHYQSNCSGGGGRTSTLFGGKLYVRDQISGNVILDALTGAASGTFNATRIPAFLGSRGFFLHQGTLYARDAATLQLAWSFVGDGSLVSAPLVVGGHVIVGSQSGNLYVLDAPSGNVLWSGNVGASISAPDEQNVSSPLTGLAAADGVLVVPAGSSVIGF